MEKLKNKVDELESVIVNTQENFTRTLVDVKRDIKNNKNEINILKQQINKKSDKKEDEKQDKKTEKNTDNKPTKKAKIDTEEGFTNLSINSLPPIVIALLITLLVYILNIPVVSKKLNIGSNKKLASNNIKLLIILVVSYILVSN